MISFQNKLLRDELSNKNKTKSIITGLIIWHTPYYLQET